MALMLFLSAPAASARIVEKKCFRDLELLFLALYIVFVFTNYKAGFVSADDHPVDTEYTPPPINLGNIMLNLHCYIKSNEVWLGLSKESKELLKRMFS